MTVFIAHAPADRAVAEQLAKAIERRGQFVELEDGETGMRPLVNRVDVVVALVSRDFVFSPWRLRLEQRTLEAWAEGRLVLVKLDHHFAPVGLRDLPFVDASFEAQRDPFTWNEVAKRVVDISRPAPPAREAAAPPGGVERMRAPAPQPMPAPARKGGGGGWLTRMLLAAIVGAGLAGAVALLGQSGLLTPVLGPVFYIGLIAVALVLSVVIARAPLGAKAGSPAKKAPKAARETATGATPEPETAPWQIFISYARANTESVKPLVEAISTKRKVWMDTAEIGGGDGWAGEIVRAIKSATEVVVMCSQAAFQSDHVKREVYLADRYKKRLVPVYLEVAETPEDFEYFFASVQPVTLATLVETERAPAVLKAIS